MTHIKEIVFPVLWLVLFSFLVHMMSGHFRHIAIPNDQMDEEADILRDVKKLLPAGSHAAFATNINNDELAGLVYYQAQFGCCPLILSGDVSRHDNIIFYRSSIAKDSDMTFMHHCDTLYQRSGSAYTVMLLRKAKRK